MYARNYLLDQVNLGEFVLAVSWALDLANPKIYRHATRVAYIALNICSVLGLAEKQRQGVLFAALLHDAGISSSELKLSALNFDLGSKAKAHCQDGYEFFKKSQCLSSIASLILHHHTHWEELTAEQKKEGTSEYLGNIIHLADRIEISVKRDVFILLQKEKIKSLIEKNKGSLFAPELVDVFLQIAENESFWLELESEYGINMVIEEARSQNIFIPLSASRELALIFADIIDRKSPFTLKHSRGVAKHAVRLAESMGLSEEECNYMEIAGLLHDLGKLSVPDPILEKPAALTTEEMLIMKQHAFHTYHLLSQIKALSEIKEWAAFHHEKLNGSGYPFALQKKDISLTEKKVPGIEI